jgi:hypothetical protein
VADSREGIKYLHRQYETVMIWRTQKGMNIRSLNNIQKEHQRRFHPPVGGHVPKGTSGAIVIQLEFIDMKYFTFSLVFFLSGIVPMPHVLSQTPGKVKGKVVDESGTAFANVKVSVDHSVFYITDHRGYFEMTPGKELIMPFEISVEKKGYKVDRFTFNEMDNEMEIILLKIKDESGKTYTVTLIDESGVPLTGLNVLMQGNQYSTDHQGTFEANEILSSNSVPVISGYTFMDMDFNEEAGKYLLKYKKSGDASVYLPDDLPKQPDSLFLNDHIFKDYKDDLDKLTREIIDERIRLEGSNEEIRKKISTISLRLKNEKNLTEVQRNELHESVGKLESALSENMMAFHQSQEKTNVLIRKLKEIILQKERIHNTALQKIEAVQKEKKVVEKKFRRNLVVFSIITVALLMLAMVFYSIAAKMKKHKGALFAANDEIMIIKKQLEERDQEIVQQKEIIKEQRKILDSLT